MGKRKTKTTPVTYELINPDSEIGEPIYRQMHDLVAHHHEELRNARIAVAWNIPGWKGDADGRETIGRCKKATAIDRELAPYDFVVIVSKRFWYSASEKQRAALIDHELCHAAVKYDADGEPVIDERGRQVFRTRRHDLEEFSDVVGRHGLYKRDLETFAKAVDRARSTSNNVWIGFSSLGARLDNAGFKVPVMAIVEWSEDQRRSAHEWLEIRRELLKANSGAAAIPPAPKHVLAATVQPSVLEQTGA